MHTLKLTKIKMNGDVDEEEEWIGRGIYSKEWWDLMSIAAEEDDCYGVECTCFLFSIFYFFFWEIFLLEELNPTVEKRIVHRIGRYPNRQMNFISTWHNFFTYLTSHLHGLKSKIFPTLFTYRINVFYLFYFIFSFTPKFFKFQAPIILHPGGQFYHFGTPSKLNHFLNTESVKHLNIINREWSITNFFYLIIY